jgi:hypothetical protein
MRRAWFEYVSKIRRKESRKQKLKNGAQITHRQAMSIASTTWGKEKLKIERKMAREKRKSAKVIVKLVPPVDRDVVLEQ